MRKFVAILLLTLGMVPVWADEKTLVEVGTCTGAMIDQKVGDTLYLASELHDLWVYPKMRFKNKRAERYFWRTVRDVKKTLPYAKEIAKEMDKTSALMATMSKKDQKKFWSQYEKLLFARYEGDFRRMTASQGQMLMLLVDRECNQTSYECIKLFKGRFIAGFWQGVAKIFGNDLKEHYDPDGRDRMIERIIHLVEAGQL